MPPVAQHQLVKLHMHTARAGEKFPSVASSTRVFPGTASMAATFPFTTVPTGISSLSNAYTGSTVLPWIA